jgi:hypothetical protein
LGLDTLDRSEVLFVLRHVLTPSDAVLDFDRATREHLDVLERQDALSDELDI